MISEAVYLHYLNSLLEGDKKQCIQIINGIMKDEACIKDIYINLFQRSMYRIGQMWEREKCSIGEEHIASKITESLIEYVSLHYSKKEIGKTAIITGIDKEFHELGARMVAGYLEAIGWRVYFVGANIPNSEIIAMIKEKEPDLIGISSSFYINIVRLAKLINEIKDEFPHQQIIVGGQALADGRDEGLSRFKNVSYINSLDSLEKYLDTI